MNSSFAAPPHAAQRTILIASRWRRWFALCIVGLCAAACGRSTAAPDESSAVVRLRVSIAGDIHAVAFTPGDSLRISVSALNAAGDSLAGSDAVRLQSRDTTVVTVDASRRIHAVRGGVTYVVGTLLLNGQDLADSLQVFVTSPVAAAK